MVYKVVKRCVDFTFSLSCLILFFPILMVLYFLMLFSSGRPVIFKSRRVGKGKRLFTVYKFRTLKNGLKRTERGVSPKIVSSNLAKFMRDTHLDESLQFLNIIKGEMSLIGPRPLDLPRYKFLRGGSKKWDHIFYVKPGMTGLNQLARYADKGLERARRLKGLNGLEKRSRLKLDRYYVDNQSFFLDLKIAWWTIEYLVVGFFKELNNHLKA